MSLKVVCVTVCLVACVYAEVTTFTTCPEVNQDACTVSEVRITPCREKAACLLKKKTSPSISFDFTPNFSASSLKSALYWASNAGDVPFPEMNGADGCQQTSCPVESGKTQALNYSLYLNKSLPTGSYDFKWKTWNAEDASQVCCFITKIQIRR